MPSPVIVNRLSSYQKVENFSFKTFQDDPLTVEESSVSAGASLTKLESLLKEKNIEIDRFRRLLEVERKNTIEYEKIKNLLQRQIFESRQMNKEVQRELKSLQAQAEMLDAQTNKLKTELVYKDQLLLKKDYQLTELNTALQGHILPQTSDHLPKKSNSDNSSDSSPELEWRNKN